MKSLSTKQREEHSSRRIAHVPPSTLDKHKAKSMQIKLVLSMANKLGLMRPCCRPSYLENMWNKYHLTRQGTGLLNWIKILPSSTIARIFWAILIIVFILCQGVEHCLLTSSNSCLTMLWAWAWTQITCPWRSPTKQTARIAAVSPSDLNDSWFHYHLKIYKAFLKRIISSILWFLLVR